MDAGRLHGFSRISFCCSFIFGPMKILIAPDKFKGSAQSLEVCSAIVRGIKKVSIDHEIHVFPMADGGDGFSTVMKHYLHTETRYVGSVDPLGREIIGSYEYNPREKIAIIEVANCSGLVLVNNEKNPLQTSTFGTGIQVKHAIDSGCDRILLGLGGSATSDAGMGILYALGFVLLGENDVKIEPGGGNMVNIRKILPPPVFINAKFEIACDVNNPMYGPEGAAHVFAPQKGADKYSVEILDRGLRNIADIIFRQTGKDVSSFPGSGAAGGIAAGLSGFLDVQMKEGIRMIMDASNIMNHLKEADLIITGEGKIDDQSTRGKATGTIALLGQARHIPVVAIVGRNELPERDAKRIGLTEIISIGENLPEEESIERVISLIEDAAERLMKTLLNPPEGRT